MGIDIYDNGVLLLPLIFFSIFHFIDRDNLSVLLFFIGHTVTSSNLDGTASPSSLLTLVLLHTDYLPTRNGHKYRTKSTKFYEIKLTDAAIFRRIVCLRRSESAACWNTDA